MSPIVCEVCGKPSSIHVTDVDPTRAPEKVTHHYCRDHGPPELQLDFGGQLVGREDEARLVDQLIARLDAREMDASEKADVRRKWEKLAEDIRAGRKRLGDAD